MAKAKHNRLLDTINNLILNAQEKGLVHLYTEGEHSNGRYLTINGQKLHHFGTTSYLALEQDQRLKDAAIAAIQQYGTQFPMSKTYVSFGMCKELEACLRNMFNRPVATAKNSTLAHSGLLPCLLRDEDALILDQQVHASVQSASQLLKPRGITVQLIKHSNMEMLENMILRLRDTHDKIWYAADGIYSMFGDTAPLAELMTLVEKYPQFHLYLDDVHGMSWSGKHGTGYVMSQLGELPERVVLVTTLGKSFGASGAVAVFGTEALYESYRIFGGPQTFSVQADPASVAAALASAKIHLSDEIYMIQEDLIEKVNYCRQLLHETTLPLIKKDTCPVHFIGTGVPAIAYNLARRLLNDGFYVNVATFPVVPARNTGIRFSISRHNQKEEIKGLIEAMERHYPEVLAEEGYTMNQVRAAFQLPPLEEKIVVSTQQEALTVQIETTVADIDATEWDQHFGERGAMDWHALCMYERVFTGHKNPQHNWQFIYLIIRDQQQQVVLATFFTIALWKDDLLAPADISRQIEDVRKTDPDYLISRVLGMGTLVTEGEHLFVDREHPYYHETLKLFSVEVESLREAYECTTVALRDIQEGEQELDDIFHTQGYFRVNMPDSSIIEDINWTNVDEYLARLSKKSRYHVRHDVLQYQDAYEISINDTLSTEEIGRAFALYLNVSNNNYALNNVEYPRALFEAMSEDPRWEFIMIRLRAEHLQPGDDALIGIVCSYTTPDSYCAVVMGMDYQYAHEYKLYKQSLFQMAMRGQALGKCRTFLGMTAAQEKRKYGATAHPRIAYIQAQDNYKLELIESMAVVKA